MDIDIVVPWVTDTDLQWRMRRDAAWETWASFRDEAGAAGVALANGEQRYRDWNLLPYWFRGIEQYAPWVRQIVFITEGHLPFWLEVDHPRLTIVRHQDYMPPEYLPTFQSNAIELNVHRIEGLSEHFVLFNDDTFLVGPASPAMYFRRGLPRLPLAPGLAYVPTDDMQFAHTLLNNAAVISRYFSLRCSIAQHPIRWLHPLNGPRALSRTLSIPPLTGHFLGLQHMHMPMPHCRSTFDEVWSRERELLDAVCRRPFRSTDDISHWLMSDWNVMSGRAYPTDARKYSYHIHCDAMIDEANLCRKLSDGRKTQICLIDDTPMSASEIAKARSATHRVMRALFPVTSSFERWDATAGEEAFAEPA